MGADTLVYLVLYNSFALLGWAYLWYLQVSFYVTGKTDFWKTVEIPLKIVQTSALLEILHSALRLVRSPVMTTAIQVLGRLFILWGYVNIAPQSQQSWALNLLIHAWSIVEVPRYLFYLFKLLEMDMPKALLFLRYNLFYVLYPLGML